MAQRNRIVLIADYIKRSAGGKTPTAIRYEVGLSSVQSEEIRKLLLDSELLTIEGNNGNTKVKPSDKGREFLKIYREMERKHEWIYLEGLAV